MGPLGFALITLVCTFGCALLGMTIRSSLPETHRSKESQDVVRLGMGLVATMTALLLGLVTAAAKGSFDVQDNAVRTSAVNVLTMDRYLARYGPETQAIRDLLRTAVASRIEAMWGAKGVEGLVDPTQKPAAEQLEDRILALNPTTEVQLRSKSEALRLCDEVLKARWRVLQSQGGSVPRVFLGVVIMWLTFTFASFGLFAPRNATVAVVLFIAAVSVAAAVFLILELDDPFRGFIKISSNPFRYALTYLGK